MDESAETLERLREVIERSTQTGGPAIRRNFIGGGWAMSAEEFVEFWDGGRMASVSTASAGGSVHVAPLDVRLVDGRFYLPTFADSRRLRDHRHSPRCAIASWDGPYHAVIVYGIAREVPQDPAGTASARANEQAYDRADVVTVEVEPTRIYGIRPPPGHAAAAKRP